MEYIDSDGQVLLVKIDKNNTKRYYNSNYRIHRLNGPAVEDLDGGYCWFRNGQFHIIGGPTVHWSYSDYFLYYINNKEVEVYYICG